MTCSRSHSKAEAEEGQDPGLWCPFLFLIPSLQGTCSDCGVRDPQGFSNPITIIPTKSQPHITPQPALLQFHSQMQLPDGLVPGFSGVEGCSEGEPPTENVPAHLKHLLRLQQSWSFSLSPCLSTDAMRFFSCVWEQKASRSVTIFYPEQLTGARA